MKHVPSVTKEHLEQVIDETIILQTHAQRNRNLMKRRLIDGLTYEELAEEFDLSVKQVGNIITASEDIIFKRL